MARKNRTLLYKGERTMDNEVIGLIAGISGEILAKKLHQRKKRVALIEGKKGESGEETADLVCVADLRNTDKIDEFLKTNSINKIIIGTGHILALLLAKELEGRGYCLSNNVDASLLAKDKVKYKEALINAGFQTPKYLSEEFENEPITVDIIKKHIGLPCVVKSPIDKILPQKVNSEYELKQAITDVRSANSPVLIEQFVSGIDVTVPVVVKGKTAETVIVSYYSKAKECHLKGFMDGDLENKTLSDEDEKKLRNYCEQAALKTGMEGLCRIDAIITSDRQIFILEANSIMVTGVHPNQIEYGRYFLEREHVDFADILIDVAINKFEGKA